MYSCPICGTSSEPDYVRLGDFRIWRCLECGMRFAPDAFAVPVDYDAVYGTQEYWENQVSDLERLSRKPKQFTDVCTYRAFFARVRWRANARLLDVGCGVGRFCQAAHVKGWDVTGIDISAQAVELARRYAKFPVYHLSLQDMLEQGERFDVVTAFEVLEHLSRPLDFLLQCQQVLHIGGEFFCTVPNWDCAEIQTAKRKDWVPPIHLCFYTQGALQHLGHRAGFRKVQTGVIWSDPIPGGLVEKIKWVRRRLLRRARAPLGLWMHAWL